MRSISSCIHTLNNVIYIVTVDKKTWINCNIYQFIYGGFILTKTKEGTTNYYIHMYMYVSAKERHSLGYVK